MHPILLQLAFEFQLLFLSFDIYTNFEIVYNYLSSFAIVVLRFRFPQSDAKQTHFLARKLSKLNSRRHYALCAIDSGDLTLLAFKCVFVVTPTSIYFVQTKFVFNLR